MIIGLNTYTQTTLGIWQYALYHSASNFKQPDLFIPERLLGDVRFENDKKDLHQPFSYGPRNCIGMKYVCILLPCSLVA